MATRRQGRSNDRGTRRGGRAPAASAYDTGAAPTGSVDAAADTELQVDIADGAPAEPVRPLAAADDVKIWAEQTWAEQTWAEDAADPIHHGGEAPADDIPSDGATQDALPSTPNDAERIGGEGEIVFSESTAPDDASHAPTSEPASEDAAGAPAKTDDDGTPDALLPREIESAIASAQPVILPPPRALSVSALTEITAANDTLAAFLRNEGLATVAHWRALTTAKSPGDAIRLQVSEFQRAADASLNCMASLARRAGRIAATVGRA